MTSKSIDLGHSPFLLKPEGKSYIWGGNELKKKFFKDIDLEPLAETWECSTHPDGCCKVETGEHEGDRLDNVLERHREYLGAHCADRKNLPILIKLIDAKEDLSIQVHPDDKYAFINENGSLGKHEMWYVLEAEEKAELIYGFRHEMNRDKTLKSLESGNLNKHLQKIPVNKNDVFFVKAGTVHAICRGSLIAEIQQSSNITYRLHDYDRVGIDGKTRNLHIKKALDVLSYSKDKFPYQPMRVLRYSQGCAKELLCRCEHFNVERMLINVEENDTRVKYQSDMNSFHVLLCIEGGGGLYEKRNKLEFKKGTCIFIPANSSQMELFGNATFLIVSC
ncbi:MAG: type I phosphomannose isomerase catalytic subunit [Suipraeoptans sp.]